MGDILFLAHRVPYPPDRGDKMRSFHLLRLLSGMARVHLCAFADDPSDVAHAEALRPMVSSMHVEQRRRGTAAAALLALASGRPVSLTAFASGSMSTAVTQILNDQPIDTVFAFSGQMAQFMPQRPGLRFIMDFVDVDSAKFEDYARVAPFSLRWMHRREARLLSAFEAAVARRADLSLFVSDAEAVLFRHRSGLGDGSVMTLENGIDLDRYSPDAAFPMLSPSEAREGPLIVFTGQMDYRPNVDAALAFATATLPRIRVQFPQVRFAIVGRNPPSSLRRLDGVGGVVVTGTVEDVRSWIAAAAVVVAPLGIARGVQNKVLEAMAMGRPVAASPAAFEGIGAVAGRDLLVGNDDVMAASVCSLLGDPARAAAIGRAGRALVEARYDWQARGERLARIVGRADASAGLAA